MKFICRPSSSAPRHFMFIDRLNTTCVADEEDRCCIVHLRNPDQANRLVQMLNDSSIKKVDRSSYLSEENLSITDFVGWTKEFQGRYLNFISRTKELRR